MGVVEAPRRRDAARSRVAILDAAERLFAERGLNGASLSDIAHAAQLSRATPSYFYGSKEQLYVHVLERVFVDRQDAARRAFEPLMRWVEKPDPFSDLRKALRRAVDGYLSFLIDRPAFVRLLQWEDLTGGGFLRATPREPNAMRVGFEALRDVAPAAGLKSFDVDDALFVFVSLTFSPLTQRNTFMAVLGRDLTDASTRRRHVDIVVGQVLHLIAD